jgi:hypothetical protein
LGGFEGGFAFFRNFNIFLAKKKEISIFGQNP